MSAYLCPTALCEQCPLLPQVAHRPYGIYQQRVGCHRHHQQHRQAVKVRLAAQVKLDPVAPGRIPPDGGIITEVLPDS
jgi:hypothetical protein